MRLVIVVLALCLTIRSVEAQDKVPVYVNATENTSDVVGSNLVYAVKEKVRSSAGMRLIYTPDSLAYELVIVHMQGQTSEGTIYSETIVWRTLRNVPYFITSFVGKCGSSRVDDCAGSIVADLDRAMDDLRQAEAAVGRSLTKP